MKKQVKFSSLQRFDLGDAVDLQGLVDDQLTLQNFGLKGGTKTSTLTGGMILSPFSCSSVGPANGGLNDANAYITLSQFSFMLPNGEVVQHTDAAETISYVTLKNAAISANAARIGYLWGNYNLVNTNQESRKFYSTLDEAEYNQTVFTRTEKQPTFVITTTSGQPGAINGRLWTRLATVTVALSGGFYKVASVNDVKQYNEMAGMQYYKPLEVTSTTSSTRFGLGPYWNNIEEMFYKLITNGSADDTNKTALGYGANPQYSLQGLKYEVDQKTGIDVVASAKLTFQAVSSTWSNFNSHYVDIHGEGTPVSNNIITEKGRRDEVYQFAYNPAQDDDEKPGRLISFYKFDNVLVTTNNCNFIDKDGNPVVLVSDLPLYPDVIIDPSNRALGSKSLIRLGISSAINAVSTNLINSIIGTNQIKITVTPTWRLDGYGVDNAAYGVNGCNSLVQVVKQADLTLATDAEEKTFYSKIYQQPTASSLYVDINCLMCSPWMFYYLNEILWRNMSDPNAVTVNPPDFITVHIDIMGDKRYL